MMLFQGHLILFASYTSTDGKDYHVLQELNDEFEPVQTIDLGNSTRPTKNKKFAKTSGIEEEDIVLITNEMFYKVSVDGSKIYLFDKVSHGKWDVKIIKSDLSIDETILSYTEPKGAENSTNIIEYASDIDYNSNYVALRSEHTVEYAPNSKGNPVIQPYTADLNALKYVEVTNMATGDSEKINVEFEGVPLQGKVKIMSDKSIVIAGAYSKDYKYGSRSYLAHGTFVIKLNPDYSLAYTKTKEFDAPLNSVMDATAASNRSNYETVYVEDVLVFDNDDILVLMEQEQALRSANGYVRSRNELILVNCKKNGEIQPEHIIEKYQNPGGIGGLDASSFKAVMHEDIVYIIFNSQGKSVAPNLKSKDPRYSKYLHADLVKVTVDNVVDQRELYAYPTTYTCIVSPGTSFMLNEKEFFMFCKNMKRSSAKVARVFVQNVFR